jgi:hypothetical protein
MRLGLATFGLLGLLVASSADAQEAYEGRIDGEYNGWTGETVYKPAALRFRAASRRTADRWTA